jgi:hypothetical protein
MSEENFNVATAGDEDTHIADMQVALRKAVAAGLQNGCYEVHVGGATFSLSSTEGEAFQAAYAGEESFRGRLAATFVELASVYARLAVAHEEFKAVESSTYLWQPKAESLKRLVPRASTLLDKSEPVLAAAKQRGLMEKVIALSASRERLQRLNDEVQTSLRKRK